MLEGNRVLLIITGGIAAYKSLEVIRRLKERGAEVRCVLTQAATHLVTPLSVAALSEARVHTDLFSLADETEIGHIHLARSADLVLVAPATANIIAKMRCGLADDLASTLLLAADGPILLAPAMNVRMWEHPATRDNIARLVDRGIETVGPGTGDLACGESGPGRMAEPLEIVDAAATILTARKRLVGRKILVTSGPTHEPIDPVRYIANRSSGKQGHAVAAAAARLGAEVVLVSGPTALPDPGGVRVVHVERAAEMLEACRRALPVDAAILVAAVADWAVAEPAEHKVKKGGGPPPSLTLTENPDILASLASAGELRPRLLIGFAAETEDVAANAAAKRQRKRCDWIVANDVSPASGTFGGDRNSVTLITGDTVETWPQATKAGVAQRLVARIADLLAPE